MEFSFMTQVNAPKEKIWEYYADIQKWYVWESDLKNITLNNGFKADSTGIMELEGLPPMEYVLTSVKLFQEFWDKTDTPLGSIFFGHEIFEISTDRVNIKHTVKLASDTINEEKVSLLKNIFAGVPDSVLLLKKVVES
ncbi:polyketide cyclase [Listeria farberi]|uniref:Polyketide cyclase n=1 Tax=Listeria farberi TaxID=2713500 RepID=A0A7X0ZJ04_9LIST|nr:polyketide cyclase [Listeria farberi]MBC1376300.1 polyketide cyclase [Listeria farberi]MBC1380083.1 polyketide cyclase [Listeria farberi]MBC2288202.1 polyketide cyclase [Listeria farberi]